MSDADARARYQTRVERLEAFGDRGSATPREREAAEYLAAELRAMGFGDARLEPFRGCGSMGQRLFAHAISGVAAAALLWVAPWVAAIMGLVTLVSLVVEASTKQNLLTEPLVRDPSQNVVAVAPAQGAAQRRIVVMGHYDTQRTGWIWADALQSGASRALLKAPGLLKSPMFPVLFALALVPVAGVLAAIGVGGVVTSVLAGLALLLTSVASVLLGQWAWGPYVPGANDNATGACAVLSLAERWLAAPVEGVEVVFAATGCEETGLIGATALAERYAGASDGVPTSFLNLDSLGYGRPLFVSKEYSLAGLPYAYPPATVALATRVAEELGLDDAGPHVIPVATDGLPFLARNLPGVSILAWEKDGHMPNYHQLTDTSSRMSFDVAWQAVGFADAVLRRMAAAQNE